MSVRKPLRALLLATAAVTSSAQAKAAADALPAEVLAPRFDGVALPATIQTQDGIDLEIPTYFPFQIRNSLIRQKALGTLPPHPGLDFRTVVEGAVRLATWDTHGRGAWPSLESWSADSLLCERALGKVSAYLAQIGMAGKYPRVRIEDRFGSLSARPRTRERSTVHVLYLCPLSAAAGMTDEMLFDLIALRPQSLREASPPVFGAALPTRPEAASAAPTAEASSAAPVATAETSSAAPVATAEASSAELPVPELPVDVRALQAPLESALAQLAELTGFPQPLTVVVHENNSVDATTGKAPLLEGMHMLAALRELVDAIRREQSEARASGARLRVWNAKRVVRVIRAFLSGKRKRLDKSMTPTAVEAPSAPVMPAPAPQGGGWLGAKTSTEDCVVATVHADSPAEAAGLREGDQIIELDGQPTTARAFHDALSRTAPGVRVRLGVLRSGARLDLHAELKARAPP